MTVSYLKSLVRNHFFDDSFDFPSISIPSRNILIQFWFDTLSSLVAEQMSVIGVKRTPSPLQKITVSESLYPSLLSSLNHFGKIFDSPPFKFSPCCKICSHMLDNGYYVKNINVREMHAFVIKNFEKDSQGSQIRTFRIRDLSPKIIKLRQVPSNEG